MKKILVVNGPNLNMLGSRDVRVYGADTLPAICDAITEKAAACGIAAEFFQSGSEGALIEAIHSVKEGYDGMIINAGAYSHYSYAIADAIACIGKPVVEVHLSNIYARESFRHTSVLSSVCQGVICGFGKTSYLLAVEALRGLM